MIVQRTLDVGVCLSILTDPEIFDLISEDGATFNDLHVDVIKDYWLSIYDEKLIGVMQIKPITSSCYEGHIHILKDHRKKCSNAAGHRIIEWCKENLKGTLYAHTPSYCKNVINFLEKFGFSITGVIPKAWGKNCELHDLTILTRVI
jgi:N-acetylglutamate synthase-like GNAT family acetyltransferase